MFTLFLETAFLALALSTVALLGLSSLLQSGDLRWVEALRLGLLAVAALALTWGTWRLILDRDRSRRALARLVALWNRVAGRLRRVEPGHAAARLAAFQSSLSQLRTVSLWKFILAAYGRVLLDAATLAACFVLFGKPANIGTMLTGYGIILVISGLAALPGGLGVADASVPVVFARLGVPASLALAAGLTYRLIAFWLLRFIGFVSWQVLESRP